MSSTFVSVACKLPHGLIMELGQPGSENYRSVKLRGPNTLDARGKLPVTVGGYAFTQVPEDFWKAWSQQHKRAAFLLNRAVYSESDTDRAQAAALTDANLVTGFERLNPDKPAPGVEPDTEHLKQTRMTQPVGAAV